MKEKEMMATMSGKQDEQRITSLDIAAVTGKQHKDVLKAIRKEGTEVSGVDTDWHGVYKDYCIKEKGEIKDSKIKHYE